MAYNNNNDVRQFELSQPPSDGISNLVYSKSGLLLVSSWDSVLLSFSSFPLTFPHLLPNFTLSLEYLFINIYLLIFLN